jgi:MFS family permease
MSASVALERPARWNGGWYRLGLPLANGGFNLGIVAPLSVLLPLQVQAAVGGNVETASASFGLLAAFGALMPIIASPLMGTISDRTTWRLGPRNSWILLGAVAGALALALLGRADTYVALVAGWCAVQFTLNAMFAALTATIPDRVPAEQRGTYSSLYALGIPVGSAVAAGVAAAFVGNVSTGYLVLAGIVAATGLVFILLCPDQTVMTAPSARALRGFLDPLRHRDFRLAFLARFLLVLGAFLFQTQQVFYLQSVAGMAAKEAATVAAGTTSLFVLGLVLAIVSTGPISDRVGRRKPFVIACSVLVGVAAVAPLLWPSAGAVAVYMFIAGTAFGTYFAVDTALMTQVLPSTSDAGKDLGILNVAGVLPQAIAPVVAAALIGTLGYSAVFVMVIVFALLGAATVVPIRSVR